MAKGKAPAKAPAGMPMKGGHMMPGMPPKGMGPEMMGGKMPPGMPPKGMPMKGGGKKGK